MDWNVYGHDWVVDLLSSHVAGKRWRQAYLFVGPEGVGRRTLALRFAQALNCTQPPEPGGYCGVCRDCRQIAAMQHPDLSLVVPDEGHQDILIDQIRDLQHTIALAPYASAYRIALLPDFQHVTDQAQNALLKTLEEPPDKVILLLTVNAIERLLPTVISRCEVIRLRPASIGDTQQFLHETRGLEPEQAALIAHLSSGRIGTAIRMAENPEILASRQEWIEKFLDLLPAKRYERFKAAEELSKSYDTARTNAIEAISFWLSFWRDVFVRASGTALPLVNVDLAAQVEETAAKITESSARALVIAHEEALQHLDSNVNVRLLLETLMLKWPQLSVAAISK